MSGPARGGAEDDVLRRIPDVAALQAAPDDVDYLADPGLTTALFLAVRLPQPILFEGEPGVGKTEAAKALARVLDTPLYRLQCYEGIDSGEALYGWNYPRQLLGIRLAEVRDAQLDGTELFGPEYLLRRPLLKAIEHSGPRPAVLLLDEIDRTDAEFEAFTFELLAESAVTIPDFGTVRATHPPVVILTSNRTRDLHDALTRRCLYHWIDYPAPDRIAKIVRRRVPSSAEPIALQAASAITRLRSLDMDKPPGIAEAIDWVSALTILGVERLDVRAVDQIWGTILKNRNDHDLALARGADGWSETHMPDRVGALAAPSVEAAGLAVGFSTALRRAGLTVPPDRAARLAEAIRLVPPHARDALYWTSRVVLVSRREQLPVFDAVFAAVFDGMLDPADSRGGSTAPPPVGGEPRTRPTASDGRPAGVEATPQHPTMSPGGDSESGAGPARDTILAMASSEEHLHDVAFADLAADELAEMRRLVRDIVLATPTRRSRRTRRTPHRSARLDLRRTVKSAHRAGGDLIRLICSQRRTRSRRLMLLCDVSASMEPCTRVFLSLPQGSVVGAGAEASVFSTRLTRLIRQLTVGDPDQSLARTASAASDWAGGTRLAESIRSFIDDHGRRGLARGAVIVVLSDGWAQDAPEFVGEQMARLSRLAYRTVWVNPRKVAVDCQPLVGGLAAALTYCDAFVSGHSYTALTEVAAAIRAERPSHPERNRGPDNATR